jgi:hypothetical protein
MERKRKFPSPHFRLPVPFNPIGGEQHHLNPPLRPYCRFVLTEALTKSDERAEAEIQEDRFQWGPGMYHLSGVPIIVRNLLDKDETGYEFEGEVDDIGIAVWDVSNHWRIIWLGATAQPMHAGIVITSAIPAGESGTVEQTDCSWVGTGTTYTVYNPHDIELPIDLHVRWGKIDGWTGCGDPATDWIVEPWHWTECP